MRTVWKFDLELGVTTLEVYQGSRITMVGHDSAGKRSVWVEVDTGAASDVVELVTVGTSHPVPDGATHAGSFMEDGYLIWHVYRTKGGQSDVR